MSEREVALALTSSAVARELAHCGFHMTEQAAHEAMTEVVAEYASTLGTVAVEYAAHCESVGLLSACLSYPFGGLRPMHVPARARPFPGPVGSLALLSRLPIPPQARAHARHSALADGRDEVCVDDVALALLAVGNVTPDALRSFVIKVRSGTGGVPAAAPARSLPLSGGMAAVRPGRCLLPAGWR